jgi:hypothetical protein
MIRLTSFTRVTIRSMHVSNRSRSLRKLFRLAAAFALVAFTCGNGKILVAQTKTATTTTLAITSGTSASPVSTTASGTVITLTAAVTAGSTPLTVGQVNFCVATAKSCTDIHRVGLAQLTSAGTAVMKFRPGPGSHQYKAVFAGTIKYAGSASAAASLSVTGPTPTTTLLSRAGVGSSVTATVFGNGSTAPSGDISILNTSNPNAVQGSVTLGNAVAGFGFNPLDPLSYISPRGISAIAAGDFNADGIPDVAVVAGVFSQPTSDYSVFIQFGLGNGSFSAPVAGASLASFSGPDALAAGDFNGDGKLDLAVADNSGVVLILLGNGDGTFTATTSNQATATGPVSLAAADFNDDGILDLAIANNNSGIITIFLGNGDGTFTPTAATLQPGGKPYFVTTGDFNGDGISDVTVLSTNVDSNNNVLSVYLGNGDGTFTLVTNGPGTGTQADAVAVGDFNADGIEDLAIVVQPDPSHNTVTVLTGSGDGTFKAGGQTTIPLDDIVGYTLLETGDFNGDSKVDLVLRSVLPLFTHELTALLGDGAGGFSPQPPSIAAVGDFDIPNDLLVIGDWNGDGVDDIVAPLTAIFDLLGRAPPDSLNVLLTENQSATATVNGINVAPGTYMWVMASYPGDKNYQPSTSSVVILAGPTGAAVASVTITPSAATITDQQSVNLNVTVSGGQGMATPTGSVYLFAAPYGPAMPLSNGAATFTIPAGTLSPGGETLWVVYAGDAVYAEQTGTATVTVSPVVMGATAPSPIAPGASATATVTLTAGSSYSGTLNLSCTLTTSPVNAQSPPTCALNPSTATIVAGGNATTTLTVKTTAATSAMLVRSKDRLWDRRTEAAAFAALLMIGLRARRRRWLSVLALLVTAICVVSGGCGGSHSTPKPSTPGTTAGSYVFTVKAVDSKDATITTLANVSVTVQ